MEEIFKQYGAAIITVTVILALIVIVGLFLNGNGGAISKQLSQMVFNISSAAGRISH